MAKYIVEMQMDKQEKFYFIRENESGDIVYLPSKYLMHKKRSKISPNTIQRSAFALSYYLTFLDEKQLCLDDIYQMKYIEQHEHFTDFLIWLKAGMHSREDYLKLPNNETCNAYLKEVFRFYTFMEQENKHSESLKVLSDTQMIVRNSIGIRKVLNRKSFRGYLKEKGHQGKTIEQDKIVVLLQECANSRDQVLLLLLAETGFRIQRLSFIEVTNKKNRELLQEYAKYHVGIGGLTIANIRGQYIDRKQFLRIDIRLQWTENLKIQ